MKNLIRDYGIGAPRSGRCGMKARQQLVKEALMIFEYTIQD